MTRVYMEKKNKLKFFYIITLKIPLFLYDHKQIV